jgi:hypothetical protein
VRGEWPPSSRPNFASGGVFKGISKGLLAPDFLIYLNSLVIMKIGDCSAPGLLPDGACSGMERSPVALALAEKRRNGLKRFGCFRRPVVLEAPFF